MTSEIVAAVGRVSTHKSEITIRPESRGVSGVLWANQLPIDQMYVTLANDSEVAALRQAVKSIAHSHHLDFAESGADVRRFDLSFDGERTHSIHVTPIAGRPRSPAARPSTGLGAGRTTGRTTGSPQLAIIIDDLGHDRSAADSL